MLHAAILWVLIVLGCAHPNVSGLSLVSFRIWNKLMKPVLLCGSFQMFANLTKYRNSCLLMAVTLCRSYRGFLWLEKAIQLFHREVILKKSSLKWRGSFCLKSKRLRFAVKTEAPVDRGSLKKSHAPYMRKQKSLHPFSTKRGKHFCAVYLCKWILNNVLSFLIATISKEHRCLLF